MEGGRGLLGGVLQNLLGHFHEIGCIFGPHLHPCWVISLEGRVRVPGHRNAWNAPK